jgi:hypothetical protein
MGKDRLHMTRGILGAIIGLVVGWMVAAALQRASDWIGVQDFLVILTLILGSVLGGSIGGLVGALIGAILGGILGVMAARLLFVFLKIGAMIVGAIFGWRWATAGG